jgi:hypothetical protein
MTTFLAVLILMVLALVGMAAGVLLGGRRLKGSCGGLSAVTNEHGEQVCGICGQGVGTCDESEVTVGSGS